MITSISAALNGLVSRVETFIKQLGVRPGAWQLRGATVVIIKGMDLRA
ncbi:hypothetical protein IMCC3088_2359 [Aequoribacter fuscus]|uniref:Uncharacterized protein n=1 Tax=Aequoribacter fuscus TaxID=2518989 RepID=F3KYV5_9GAMM|nr:hypothetical protein IMCC3088_2359 [Aequoribacter fuscus]